MKWTSSKGSCKPQVALRTGHRVLSLISPNWDEMSDNGVYRMYFSTASKVGNQARRAGLDEEGGINCQIFKLYTGFAEVYL